MSIRDPAECDAGRTQCEIEGILAEHIGITEANLSLLKQGKVKGVRFEYAGASANT